MALRHLDLVLGRAPLVRQILLCGAAGARPPAAATGHPSGRKSPNAIAYAKPAKNATTTMNPATRAQPRSGSDWASSRGRPRFGPGQRGPGPAEVSGGRQPSPRRPRRGRHRDGACQSQQHVHETSLLAICLRRLKLPERPRIKRCAHVRRDHPGTGEAETGIPSFLTGMPRPPPTHAQHVGRCPWRLEGADPKGVRISGRLIDLDDPASLREIQQTPMSCGISETL